MVYDEGSIEDENLGLPEQHQLDMILQQVVNTMEKGRNEIFDIAEVSRNQCHRLEVELEELNNSIKQIIEDVKKQEKLERYARLRLMEVSKNFRSYAEIDIKKAYENARELQLKLLDLQQTEMYMRKRRDETTRSIKKFKVISQKASGFLNSTGMALKILQGNIDRISGTIEDVWRQQQIGMWIIESQESERRKIARDLHDGPAQSLAGMMIRLDLIQKLWDNDVNRIYEEIGNIKQMSEESLADIRRIMFDLKPTLLHQDNFALTLKEYFADYGTKYNIDIEFVVFAKAKQYDITLETALFRMVQEAITNVRKHAGVKKALAKMEDSGKKITLIIKDEGAGFDIENAAQKAEGYGIIGMKERAELLGGEVEIISAPGKGTQVIITVPLEGEAIYGQNKSYNSR